MASPASGPPALGLEFDTAAGSDGPSRSAVTCGGVGTAGASHSELHGLSAAPLVLDIGMYAGHATGGSLDTHFGEATDPDGALKQRCADGSPEIAQPASGLHMQVRCDDLINYLVSIIRREAIAHANHAQGVPNLLAALMHVCYYAEYRHSGQAPSEVTETGLPRIASRELIANLAPQKEAIPPPAPDSAQSAAALHDPSKSAVEVYRSGGFSVPQVPPAGVHSSISPQSRLHAEGALITCTCAAEPQPGDYRHRAAPPPNPSGHGHTHGVRPSSRFTPPGARATPAPPAPDDAVFSASSSRAHVHGGPNHCWPPTLVPITWPLADTAVVHKNMYRKPAVDLDMFYPGDELDDFGIAHRGEDGVFRLHDEDLAAERWLLRLGAAIRGNCWNFTQAFDALHLGLYSSAAIWFLSVVDNFKNHPQGMAHGWHAFWVEFESRFMIAAGCSDMEALYKDLRQRPGDTVLGYADALRRLVRKLSLDPNSRKVRSRFIEGLSDNEVKNRLRSILPLVSTFEGIVNAAQEFEQDQRNMTHANSDPTN